MSKLGSHLAKYLTGEVLETGEARDYFSTDGSVFTVKPRVIVYPHSTTDVRKVVRFAWQLAERGKVLPITARGLGTDQAGAAIGEGIMLVFPAHMHRLLELDKTTATMEPGILYKDLQRALNAQDRFLPPYPSSIDFSTIGGAVANDAKGEKTLKYGGTKEFVKSLQVVLANGQLVTAERISKRALNKKKGQSDFEGQVYRELDGLLEDNKELIEKTRLNVSKNSAGYNVWDVKKKDGSFDLSRLLVGSQGTLGVVTEVTIDTVPLPSETDLMAVSFDDIHKAGQAVLELQKLEPSAMELVDYHLLDFVQRKSPERLEGILEGKPPAIMFLVEFDNLKSRLRKSKIRKARKILKDLASNIQITVDPEEQEKLWKIRRSAAAVIWLDDGKKKAVPIIEDACVPADKLAEFLDAAYKLYKDYKLELAVWGHAGDANFHMQPFLDLGSVGDRQKLFKIVDDFHRMVIEMGGTTSGEHNDGRLRAPYLPELYGNDLYELFRRIKQIMDPQATLNPGVKIDVHMKDIKPLLRKEYSMKHLYDHMPVAHT